MCVAVTLLVPINHAPWFEGRSWPHVACSADHVTCSPLVHKRAGELFRVYQIGKDCSCGWFRPADDAVDVDAAKEWDRMMKRGWSEAKARRALAQSEAARARRTSPRAGFASPIPEVVREIAEHAGVCGVIAEWVGGSDAIKYDPSLERRTSAETFDSDPGEFVFGRLFLVARAAAQRKTQNAP
ncbi:MAG: hypothetical protein HBSAPP03_07650 [Phycisphaerae bacterium]|nr:MAG: hypothetical protein HBSAPP03_07650 [Phycisphaerae bacterium]